MSNLKIGDRIRFLNTTGGGIIKGFQGKNIVLVEEDDGFETPTLITECVLIESTEIPTAAQTSFSKPTPKVEEPKEEYHSEEIKDPESEKLTIIFAIVPDNCKQLQNTTYNAYVINDCNYSLIYNISVKFEGQYRSLENGIIEPNTSLLLEEFDGSKLNFREDWLLQIIPLKLGKNYDKKSIIETEIHINPVKYCKLHCFTENEYFDEPAMIFPIVEKDKKIMIEDPTFESNFIHKKEDQNKRPRISNNKKKNTPIIEVDLHINQLLDTTAGMSNGDMLNYQLGVVEKTIAEYKNNKGQKIVFIHGKGEGVLKNEIIKLLKYKYKNYPFQDASFREYGFGATMITIR